MRTPRMFSTHRNLMATAEVFRWARGPIGKLGPFGANFRIFPPGAAIASCMVSGGDRMGGINRTDRRSFPCFFSIHGLKLYARRRMS